MNVVIYEERPSRTVTITLPNLPGAEIVGPGELDNEMFYEIQSKALKTHIEIDPETGEQRSVSKYYDDNALAWNLVCLWIEHPDTSWNLGDKDGKLLPRRRSVISRRFKLVDVMHIANELAGLIWSQTSDTGNPTESPDSPDSASKETVNSATSSGRVKSISGRTGSSEK